VARPGNTTSLSDPGSIGRAAKNHGKNHGQVEPVDNYSNGMRSATGVLVRQPHGGALRNGGANAGGPGRPSDEFKRRMREIASSNEALAFLEACVRGDHGPRIAIAAHRHVSERGYGKVLQEVGATSMTPLNVEIVMPKRERSPIPRPSGPQGRSSRRDGKPTSLGGRNPLRSALGSSRDREQ
jgi:hypothetical protein